MGPESDPVKSGVRHSHVVRLPITYFVNRRALGRPDMPTSDDYATPLTQQSVNWLTLCEKNFRGREAGHHPNG